MAIQNDANKQLSALPFGNIIGGPLVAAIDAQALAARSTVEFIESVGFKPLPEGAAEDATKEIQNVDFTYKSGEETVKLSVPLLVIVPIPYIRIDDMTIQFKANISAETAAANTSNTSSSVDVKANVTGKYGWGPGASVEASFSAAYSAKKDSSSAANSKYAVEYTMDVNVHAVHDDIPSGMHKVLNLLSDSIQAPNKDSNSPD